MSPGGTVRTLWLAAVLGSLAVSSAARAQGMDPSPADPSLSQSVSGLQQARVQTRMGTYVVLSPRILGDRLAFERAEGVEDSAPELEGSVSLDDVQVIEKPLSPGYTWAAALIGVAVGYSIGQGVHTSALNDYNDCRLDRYRGVCSEPPKGLYDGMTYVLTGLGGVSGYMVGRRWLRWQVLFRSASAP